MEGGGRDWEEMKEMKLWSEYKINIFKERIATVKRVVLGKAFQRTHF